MTTNKKLKNELKWSNRNNLLSLSTCIILLFCIIYITTPFYSNLALNSKVQDHKIIEELSYNITNNCNVQYDECIKKIKEQHYHLEYLYLDNCLKNSNRCKIRSVEQWADSNIGIKLYEETPFKFINTIYNIFYIGRDPISVLERGGTNCQGKAIIIADLLKYADVKTYFLIQERHICLMAQISKEEVEEGMHSKQEYVTLECFDGKLLELV